MKKIMILFLILFVSFIYSASSLKTFEISETEKISLGLEAEDPDADVLTYTFTSPLNDNGEWQTTYGDAGEYTVTITVSDGENEVSEEVLIIVNRKEAEPVIDEFFPKEDSININEADNIKFKVDVSDLNNDVLEYKWRVNDEVVSYDSEMLFETGYEDAGEYLVNLILSDGVFNASKEWNVNVNDVNINSVLEQIKDVVVFETETASIKLPDFKKYGLSYEISEPFGDNKWKTNYDHAGVYTVKINVEGKGFKGEKEIKVTVRDKDRAPELVGLNKKSNKKKSIMSAKHRKKYTDEDIEDIIAYFKTL